jgi:hypothetical protein
MHFGIESPNTAYPLSYGTASPVSSGCWDYPLFLAGGFAVRPLCKLAAWNLHNTMLAVKEQVIAQLGKRSNQVQALGLKKKTEYKKPVRKAKAA